jgi:hypothetical protein
VKEKNRQYELRLVDGKVESFGKLGEHSGEAGSEKEDE